MKKALLALLTLTAFLTSPAQEVKPLKVLMVCGGCCHDYANQKLILAEGISARANVEFTIVHEESRVKDDRTHQVSIYKSPIGPLDTMWWCITECFGAVTDVPFVEGIAKPHFEGVPAVMLHCSTHSYRTAKTDEWRKCVGQTSMSHEKNSDLKVRNVAEAHPIMKGFPKEWNDTKDELYKNEKLWENFTPWPRPMVRKPRKTTTSSG
ncbi:MAG: ThuA domain-containing protein [Verrucomicrobiaceae bacterium]|nr:ThuA domain-containing protein [Verrucomicrobiaceae bacterium]